MKRTRKVLRPKKETKKEGKKRKGNQIELNEAKMVADNVMQSRLDGISAEGVRDQYADGRAAKVWEVFIGDRSSRTDNYKNFLLDLLRSRGCSKILDLATGTGYVNHSSLHSSCFIFFILHFSFLSCRASFITQLYIANISSSSAIHHGIALLDFSMSHLVFIGFMPTDDRQLMR